MRLPIHGWLHYGCTAIKFAKYIHVTLRYMIGRLRCPKAEVSDCFSFEGLREQFNVGPQKQISFELCC